MSSSRTSCWSMTQTMPQSQGRVMGQKVTKSSQSCTNDTFLRHRSPGASQKEIQQVGRNPHLPRRMSHTFTYGRRTALDQATTRSSIAHRSPCLRPCRGVRPRVKSLSLPNSRTTAVRHTICYTTRPASTTPCRNTCRRTGAATTSSRSVVSLCPWAQSPPNSLGFTSPSMRSVSV